MVCGIAITIQTARLATKLGALLPPETARAVLAAFVQERLNKRADALAVYGARVSARVGNMTITIENGEVAIDDPYARHDDVAAALAELLDASGGMVLDQQIHAALAVMGALASEQVEVEDNGRRMTATRFTLTF